jgi:hypothetical protein
MKNLASAAADDASYADVRALGFKVDAETVVALFKLVTAVYESRMKTINVELLKKYQAAAYGK